MWQIRVDVHELKEALFDRRNNERPEKVCHQHISVTRENLQNC